MWLEEQYYTKKLSLLQIAKITGASYSTIHNWVSRHKLPIRSRSEGCKIRWQSVEQLYKSEDWLREQYCVNQLSTIEIAQIAGCGETSITNWMKRFGISRRASGGKPWNNKIRRKKFGEVIKRLHAEGRYKGTCQSPTSIETATDKALSDLDISHTAEYVILGRGYRYDQLVYPNILIEVQGDYWHSSEKARVRDAEKAKWAAQNGYRLITIWEHEIKARGAKQLVMERVLGRLI